MTWPEKKMEKVGEKSPHLPGVEESDILEVNIMKKAEDFPPGALGLSVGGGGLAIWLGS